MLLLELRLVGVGPFRDLTLPLTDDEGEPRRVIVVQGGAGVGKSTLLAAIASTRPGHATVQRQVVLPELSGHEVDSEREAWAACRWSLGMDDPERPHPLVIASPGATALPAHDAELVRRREQALFDKAAQGGGFALLSIPAARWFSRQPIAFSAPLRTVARYDPKGPLSAEERSDLARETKQALAYADIAQALGARAGHASRFNVLGRAMQGAVTAVSELLGYSYLGVDPASFEPLFTAPEGRALPFDALPTRARHLVAFAALTVRTLWAAYPGVDPRLAEGVVLIDEIDLLQDSAVQGAIVPTLNLALPRVQWIVTATSPTVGDSVDARDVVALRRMPASLDVEIFQGEAARTH